MSDKTIKLSNADFDHVIAALELMYDVDTDNGHPDDAADTRKLIERLQSQA